MSAAAGNTLNAADGDQSPINTSKEDDMQKPQHWPPALVAIAVAAALSIGLSALFLQSRNHFANSTLNRERIEFQADQLADAKTRIAMNELRIRSLEDRVNVLEHAK